MPKTLLKTWFAATLAIFLTTAVLAPPARAEIEVDVNRGDIQPLPIAIPFFAGEQGADIGVGPVGDQDQPLALLGVGKGDNRMAALRPGGGANWRVALG